MIIVSESDILGPIDHFNIIENLVSFERAMYKYHIIWWFILTSFFQATSFCQLDPKSQTDTYDYSKVHSFGTWL